MESVCIVKIKASANVGIAIIAPGFIHCISVMWPLFCLSSIPKATIFTVLPISVR